MRFTQGTRALLSLEDKLGVELPKEWKELGKRGLLYDLPRTSFRCSWQEAVVDREMALLRNNYQGLVEDALSPDFSGCASRWKDSDVIAWRGAVVELMGRLLTLLPKPSRHLVQHEDPKLGAKDKE